MNQVTAEDQFHGRNLFSTRFQDYLGPFVFGSIDGSITTFAVVAGASGANLESSIIIVLGFANLFADGFSMSIGSYLSAQSDREKYEKHKKIEYWEVENVPELEKEEIRVIYRNKGFEGDLLEKVVDKITSDKDLWVDQMMKEELEIQPDSRSPFAIGATTFVSFLLIGLIPLAIYVADFLVGVSGDLFLISVLLTSLAFVGIGLLKSHVNETNKIKGILETLFLGVAAAGVAYFVGDLLEKLVLS